MGDSPSLQKMPPLPHPTEMRWDAQNARADRSIRREYL
jgi:hypothetical protein